MKKITFLILFVIAGFIVGCNDNDEPNGQTSEYIIGTWKLTAELTDGVSRTLGNCELEETYIFGAAQVTHELYTSGSTHRGSDDDDDSGDDESDDSEDDSEDDDSDDSSDDVSDDSSDESSDDDSDDNTTTCSVSSQNLAFWTKEASLYSLAYSGTTETMDVVFTDSNNKFYFEKTIVVNGQTKVKRFVFQRQ